MYWLPILTARNLTSGGGAIDTPKHFSAGWLPECVRRSDRQARMQVRHRRDGTAARDGRCLRSVARGACRP